MSASDLRAAPSQLRTEFWEYTGAITAQDGEILTDGASLIIVALHADRRLVQTVRGVAYLEESEGSTTRRLAITYIGPTWDCAALAMSLDIVKEVMGLTPEPAIYSSQRFDELKAEGRESPTPPSVEEEAAVSLLSDRLLRTLALAIKTSGGLLVRDLPKQLPEARDRAVQIADRLKAGGLVDSEIVIVCGKTQAQVARAPSRDVIADLATRAVKCACGRSLAEERTEEALAITDLGRALLDKARWLTILLVRELERMGVPRHSILVEQTVGGDEIDCLAKSQGI